jgi:O-antigen ligase
LWLAGERRHAAAVRAAACVAVYAGIVALVLTYSRGGILTALVLLVVWLSLGHSLRAESIATLVLAGAAAAGAALVALSLPGVSDDGQPHSVRAHDGAWFGLVLLAGGVLVGVVALAAARREARTPLADPLRRRLTQLALGTAGVAVAAAFVVVLVRSGDPVDWVEKRAKDFTSSQTSLVTQGKTRLTDVSSNNRWPWWKDSWRLFEDHPLAGTGAGSFRIAHRRVRSNGVEVLEPHNLSLQFLSETGLVGLVLLVAAGAAAATGVVSGVRKAERPAPELALALGPLGYALHGQLDFDWDFVAVSAPIFASVGVLLGSSCRPRAYRFRLFPAAGAAVLCLGLLYSLAAPHLSARRLNDSYEALARDDAAAAAAAAKSAHSLDPLAASPYFAWATAEDSRGDEREALRLYGRAVDVQPENSETWYALARYELLLGRKGQATADLGEAARLDPHGPAASCLSSLASCR